MIKNSQIQDAESKEYEPYVYYGEDSFDESNAVDGVFGMLYYIN